MLVVLKPEEMLKDFGRAKTAKKAKFVGENACLVVLARQSLSISSGFSTTNIQYVEICTSMTLVLATRFSMAGEGWGGNPCSGDGGHLRGSDGVPGPAGYTGLLRTLI